LLAILDSPLNKANKVKVCLGIWLMREFSAFKYFLLFSSTKALYIRTHKNVLISVNPKVRLPRTFKRFCGLFAQLLQKLSIRATNGPDKLLKVSSTFTNIPPGCIDPMKLLSNAAATMLTIARNHFPFDDL
jgi:rRNA pseudouridine-1189 N-methylase Emg1 (Nep1/Mra1 family)